MKNYIQPGNVVTLFAPAGGVKSGDGLLIGALFGVAAYDAAEGAEVETSLVGVFKLPKAAGGIDAGDLVYWAASAKNVSGIGCGNTLIGAAVADAGSGDATVRVRLNGVTVNGASGGASGASGASGTS